VDKGGRQRRTCATDATASSEAYVHIYAPLGPIKLESAYKSTPGPDSETIALVVLVSCRLIVDMASYSVIRDRNLMTVSMKPY
jgi:hypothetical protein